VSTDDNCDENPSVTLVETQKDGSCGYDFTIIRTYTVTDDCGNDNSVTQKAVVYDDTPPTLSDIPDHTTIECDESISVVELTATDNCGPAHVTSEETKVDGSCDDSYWLYFVWTATDDCGNSVSDTQTVFVQDTTPPAIAVDGDTSDQPVEYPGIPAVGSATATDNCDTATEITFTTSGDESDQPCHNYDIIRVWTAFDNCGNFDDFKQTIDVNDNSPPIIDPAPADTTVQCYSMVLPMARLNATDDYTTDLTVVNSTSTSPINCTNRKFIYRKWQATDPCGNLQEETQTVTVNDDTPPVIDYEDGATTIELECPQDPFVWPKPNATDNCIDMTTWESADSSIPAPVGSNVVSITVRTWIAADVCGNTDEAAYTITVVDTTPPICDNFNPDDQGDCKSIPTITHPTVKDCSNVDVTFSQSTIAGSCDDQYDVARNWALEDEYGNTNECKVVINVVDDTPPTLGPQPQDETSPCDDLPTVPSVTATDDCAGDGSYDIPVDFSQGENVVVSYGGENTHKYLFVRSWFAEDDCGNSASWVQTVYVVDDSPPVLSDVPDSTTQDCVVPSAVQLTATDNCETVSPVYTSEVIEDLCEFDFTEVRTWYVKDSCGNSDVAVQTLTAVDASPPVFDQTPDDTTLPCVGDTAPTVTATDNCDESVDVSFYETKTETCKHDFVISRTWEAVDVCGNSATQFQTTTVTDNEAPVIFPKPASTSAACDVMDDTQVTATDDCSAASLSFSESKDITCDYDYTLYRSWFASDDCGKTDSHTQTLNAVDVTPPTLVGVPKDTTTECVVDSPPNVTGDDDCDSYEATDVTYTTSRSDNCTDAYEEIRFWSISDACGHVATATQTATAVDDSPPVFDSDIPADTTEDCDVTKAQTITATDNCASPTVDTSESVLTTSCDYDFSKLRQWYAVDNCGNSVSGMQTVTAVDNTPPVLDTPPADTTYDCDDESGNPTRQASDNCGDATVTESVSTLDSNCVYDFRIVKTWTATDECGNSVSDKQTVTVVDNTPPTVEDVAGDSYSCDVPSKQSVAASDNCSPTVYETYADTEIARTCAHDYTVVRSWTFADDCGNIESVAQTLSAYDNSPPLLSGVPKDTTEECDTAAP